MKILFDHQIFEEQQFGGISRYYFELIRNLSQKDNVKCDLSIIYSNNEYINNNKQYSTLPIRNYFNDFFWGRQFKGKAKLFKYKNTILPSSYKNTQHENKKNSIKKIKEGNFDIFHPTYYDSYFIDYLDNKPFVLTVYDLIHQIFPEFFINTSIDKTSEILHKASKIIAISESTKKDLVSLFDIDENKISVIHLSSSFNSDYIKPTFNFIYKIPEEYILFTGNRNTYKNFLFFIRVFKCLSNKFNNLFVVCTGSPFTSEEQAYFKRLNISDKIIYIYSNDNELKYLYKNAKTFIYPSQYEGFGIPILEAFSCGCPVICSRTSSFYEVAGSSAAFFDPKNAAELLETIEQVIRDDKLREKLILSGFNMLNQFSWEKTANSTLEVYNQIQNNNTII